MSSFQERVDNLTEKLTKDEIIFFSVFADKNQDKATFSTNMSDMDLSPRDFAMFNLYVYEQMMQIAYKIKRGLMAAALIELPKILCDQIQRSFDKIEKRLIEFRIEIDREMEDKIKSSSGF